MVRQLGSRNNEAQREMPSDNDDGEPEPGQAELLYRLLGYTVMSLFSLPYLPKPLVPYSLIFCQQLKEREGSCTHKVEKKRRNTRYKAESRDGKF